MSETGYRLSKTRFEIDNFLSDLSSVSERYGGVFSALSNKADKGAPKAYSLPYMPGYKNAADTSLSEYSKSENNLVVVNFVAAADNGSFPGGIITIANLPQGYCPSGTVTTCAALQFNDAGISSEYAVLAYINASGALNLHIPSSFANKIKYVQATIAFYAG